MGKLELPKFVDCEKKRKAGSLLQKKETEVSGDVLCSTATESGEGEASRLV